MRALIVEPEEELAAAIDWYDSQGPGLGAGLVGELDEVIGTLRRCELPGLAVPGVRCDDAVRRVLLASPTR